MASGRAEREELRKGGREGLEQEEEAGECGQCHSTREGALGCCPQAQLRAVACCSPLWASVFCIYMRTTTLPSSKLVMWRCPTNTGK